MRRVHVKVAHPNKRLRGGKLAESPTASGRWFDDALICVMSTIGRHIARGKIPNLRQHDRALLRLSLGADVAGAIAADRRNGGERKRFDRLDVADQPSRSPNRAAPASSTGRAFRVGQGNQVQFNNGSGATLNRVTGNVPSAINGVAVGDRLGLPRQSVGNGRRTERRDQDRRQLRGLDAGCQGCGFPRRRIADLQRQQQRFGCQSRQDRRVEGRRRPDRAAGSQRRLAHRAQRHRRDGVRRRGGAERRLARQRQGAGAASGAGWRDPQQRRDPRRRGGTARQRRQHLCARRQHRRGHHGDRRRQQGRTNFSDGRGRFGHGDAEGSGAAYTGECGAGADRRAAPLVHRRRRLRQRRQGRGRRLDRGQGRQRRRRHGRGDGQGRQPDVGRADRRQRDIGRHGADRRRSGRRIGRRAEVSAAEHRQCADHDDRGRRDDNGRRHRPAPAATWWCGPTARRRSAATISAQGAARRLHRNLGAYVQLHRRQRQCRTRRRLAARSGGSDDRCDARRRDRDHARTGERRHPADHARPAAAATATSRWQAASAGRAMRR